MSERSNRTAVAVRAAYDHWATASPNPSRPSAIGRDVGQVGREHRVQGRTWRPMTTTGFPGLWPVRAQWTRRIVALGPCWSGGRSRVIAYLDAVALRVGAFKPR